MSVESKPAGNLVHHGPMESILMHVSPEIRCRIVRTGLERLVTTSNYVYPSDFREKFIDAALKGPIVGAQSHRSDADIPVGAYALSTVAYSVNPKLPDNRKIKGFVEPFALSLHTKGQGEMLSTFYDDVIPLLGDLNVEPIPTPTIYDIKKGRVTPDEFKEWDTKSRMRIGLGVIKNHKSFLFAPEATVESGRLNEAGVLKGMQEFPLGVTKGALTVATRRTGITTVFPIGITDSDKVFDHQGNKLTRKAIAVGLGLSYEPIMTVRVGEPITFTKEEVEESTPLELDNKLGMEIAKLLNPQDRGHYGKFVTTYP